MNTNHPEGICIYTTKLQRMFCRYLGALHLQMWLSRHELLREILHRPAIDQTAIMSSEQTPQSVFESGVQRAAVGRGADRGSKAKK